MQDATLVRLCKRLLLEVWSNGDLHAPSISLTKYLVKHGKISEQDLTLRMVDGWQDAYHEPAFFAEMCDLLEMLYESSGELSLMTCPDCFKEAVECLRCGDINGLLYNTVGFHFLLDLVCTNLDRIEMFELMRFLRMLHGYLHLPHLYDDDDDNDEGDPLSRDSRSSLGYNKEEMVSNIRKYLESCGGRMTDYSDELIDSLVVRCAPGGIS